MTTEAFFNEPITVTASIDQQGQIKPTRLTWRGDTYSLITVGRQWAAEDGHSVLVEATNGDRFEIQLARKDLVWYLRRAWRGELAT